MESFGVARHSIRPSTPLSPLLPEETRRKKWKELAAHLGLAVPPLRMIHGLKQDLYMQAFVGGAVLAAAALLAVTKFLSVPLGLVLFIPGFILWIILGTVLSNLLIRMNVSHATELPANTAGELAQIVLGLNQEHFQLKEQSEKMSNEAVWLKIVDIFCDQLQVDPSEVVPNASIVDDLGVD
jgi:hypothetical protein